MSHGDHSRLDPSVLGADLNDRLARLDAALQDLAGGEGAPEGFDPNLYLAPGIPRIRPVLVLLSERATRAHVDGEAASEDAVDATEHVAIAAEMLHLAILVHDRALGQPGGRRRRAARKLLGRLGWLGANHMTLRALELARHAPAPEVVGDAVDTLREIAEGHALSETLRGRVATPDECVELAEGYSGAVFDFACRSGARIAGGDRAAVGGLGRYGRHAGVAWHLADDLTMMDQDMDVLPAALEERLGKHSPNFAVSLGSVRDPKVGELWMQLRSEKMQLDVVADLQKRLRRSGALQEGRERLAQQTWRARKALSGISPSPDREALDQLAAAIAK